MADRVLRYAGGRRGAVEGGDGRLRIIQAGKKIVTAIPNLEDKHVRRVVVAYKNNQEVGFRYSERPVHKLVLVVPAEDQGEPVLDRLRDEEEPDPAGDGDADPVPQVDPGIQPDPNDQPNITELNEDFRGMDLSEGGAVRAEDAAPVETADPEPVPAPPEERAGAILPSKGVSGPPGPQESPNVWGGRLRGPKARRRPAKYRN
jgi:hypothetical protein